MRRLGVPESPGASSRGAFVQAQGRCWGTVNFLNFLNFGIFWVSRERRTLRSREPGSILAA